MTRQTKAPARTTAQTRTFTADQLCISPLNVRLNAEDADATEALEASLAAYGLLYPLTVHPITLALREQHPDHTDWPQAEQGFGVLAGGRRLRAFRRLIAAGRLPADYAIDAVERDLPPAQITELSLAENLLRRELRPYEVHAAIARAHDQGAEPEEIAARCGQRLVWVHRQLRLGTLAPEIFAAYSAGDVTGAEAQAYAATEDHVLQRAAFAHFSLQPRFYNHDYAAEIRNWLKVGNREEGRLLRFVGEQVYRAAGGRFELDLFAEEADQRGRVVDIALLRELVDTALGAERQRLRQATGRSDLRFAAEPPKLNGYADTGLEIFAEKTGKKLSLPEGAVIATIAIGEGGKVETRFWWESRKAKNDARRITPPEALPAGHPERVYDNSGFDNQTNTVAAQAAKAAVRDDHGLSADGLQVVRCLRRELLRTLLLSDAVDGGALGRDYLIWSQLRQALRSGDRDTSVGARGLAGEWTGTRDSFPVDFVKPFLDEAGAGKACHQAVELVGRQPWMTIDDPAEAFAIYFADEGDMKDFAGAVLAGLALVRSANVPGWRIAVHDKLAALAGGSDSALREHWQPTAGFMGLFPKMKRLELAEPVAGPAATLRWSKLKDGDLSEVTAQALAETPDWVHPLMSFGVSSSDPAGDDAAPEFAEAAE